MSEDNLSTWKPDKNLPADKRFKMLMDSLSTIKEKHLRSLRNNLNNRIRSFAEESQYGKKAKELQLSHALFDFRPGECEKLLEAVQKELRTRKSLGLIGEDAE